MRLDQLKPNIIVRGPIFPEPVQVIVAIPMGTSVKLVGKGLNTNQVHEPILSAEQLAQLVSSPEKEPFDGDPLRFRLGVEAYGLASPTSTTRIFRSPSPASTRCPTSLRRSTTTSLRLPRIRFLLADDPGAGKTIMAGLLLKELKIRGLVKRTLIVTPANLSFQWQREMKDKFREKFEVIRSDVLRANYGRIRGRNVTRSSRRSRGSHGSRMPRRACSASRWDLVIVDEAHKMAPTAPTRRRSPTSSARIAVRA